MSTMLDSRPETANEQFYTQGTSPKNAQARSKSPPIKAKTTEEETIFLVELPDTGDKSVLFERVFNGGAVYTRQGEARSQTFSHIHCSYPSKDNHETISLKMWTPGCGPKDLLRFHSEHSAVINRLLQQLQQFDCTVIDKRVQARPATDAGDRTPFPSLPSPSRRLRSASPDQRQGERMSVFSRDSSSRPKITLPKKLLSNPLLAISSNAPAPTPSGVVRQAGSRSPPRDHEEGMIPRVLPPLQSRRQLHSRQAATTPGMRSLSHSWLPTSNGAYF